MRWFKFKEAIPEALLDLNLLGSIKLEDIYIKSVTFTCNDLTYIMTSHDYIS